MVWQKIRAFLGGAAKKPTAAAPARHPQQAQRGDFQALIAFYLNGLGAVLNKVGVTKEGIRVVLQAVHLGHQPMARAFADTLLEQLPYASALAEAVTRLAELTPKLTPAMVYPADILKTVEALIPLGEFAEDIDDPSTAYNIYEAASHLAVIADRPSLDIATKLCFLANPDYIDQYHSAIWRLAIESLRYACDNRREWLAALNNLELALTCLVKTQELQNQLWEQLRRQATRAKGTPIGEIVAICLVQGPASSIAPAMRAAALAELAGGPPSDGSAAAQQAVEALAVARAQAMFDDMRQKLLPRASEHASIAWHDITMRHARLSHAVPLGRALIADVRRTGGLLLDLTHEIAHAYALLGPLGFHQSAYRSVIHYFEFLLLADAEGDSLAFDTMKPLASLSRDPVMLAIADAQLGVGLRAAIWQATWQPWLEGLSVYIELLCDPIDDKNEISAVHECVRSLIDFNIQPRPEETEEAFVERYSVEMPTTFDTFFAEALRRESRFGHLSYFDSDQRDIYGLGYLVVRSIVARWETTLGRRIPPIVVVRLLLNAAQVGSFDAMPFDVGPVTEFGETCRRAYLAWLTRLAALPKDAIAEFLTPVRTDERGFRWYWEGGVPVKYAGNESRAHGLLERHFAALETMMVSLIPPPMKASEDTTRQRLSEMNAAYNEMNRLLPIGRDEVRMVFLQSPGGVGVFPRTYTGKLPTDADAGDYTDLPRYQPRFWTLKGGAEEAEKLRRLCGRRGSARLLATRIIDLGGHANSPQQRANVSYTCFFLDTDWSLVNSWDVSENLAETHPQFVALLHRRMFPPPFYADEDQGLASTQFLVDRLRDAGADTDNLTAAAGMDFNALSAGVAMAAAAAAFAAGDSARFAEAYNVDMAVKANRHALANHLHKTGVKGAAAPERSLAELAAARRVLQDGSFSGVTPFGATS